MDECRAQFDQHTSGREKPKEPPFRVALPRPRLSTSGTPVGPSDPLWAPLRLGRPPAVSDGADLLHVPPGQGARPCHRF